MLHKPGPKRVILEVTNQCNLNCSICLQRSWNESQGTMPDEVFSKLVSDLGQLSSAPDVIFGGYGEPLSHPKILDMISQVAASGSQTALITNGSLLTPLLVGSLVEAGLNKLWLSADSSHHNPLDDVYVEGHQSSAIDKLAVILGSTDGNVEKIDIGLALVITRNNQEELLGLLHQGRSLGLRSFFFTNLEAYTPDQTARLPYTPGELRQPGSWRDRTATLYKEIQKMKKVDPRVSIDGVLEHSQDKCPFAERGELVLRWDGKASPCLPLLYDRTTHVGSWEHKHYALSLGNIRDQSLTEIWTDSDYSQLRERLLNKEFSPCLGCRDCWLSEDNRQDCMGFEHPTCGGCLWAAGLISCP